jgi:hypothetical protein
MPSAKAVNSGGCNFTDAKLKRGIQEIEPNISRYLVLRHKRIAAS